jgi:hypothetical protein
MRELPARDQFTHPANSSLAAPLRGARRISRGASLRVFVSLWPFDFCGLKDLGGSTA